MMLNRHSKQRTSGVPSNQGRLQNQNCRNSRADLLASRCRSPMNPSQRFQNRRDQKIPGYTSKIQRDQERCREEGYYNRSRSRSPIRNTPIKQIEMQASNMPNTGVGRVIAFNTRKEDRFGDIHQSNSNFSSNNTQNIFPNTYTNNANHTNHENQANHANQTYGNNTLKIINSPKNICFNNSHFTPLIYGEDARKISPKNVLKENQNGQFFKPKQPEIMTFNNCSNQFNTQPTTKINQFNCSTEQINKNCHIPQPLATFNPPFDTNRLSTQLNPASFTQQYLNQNMNAICSNRNENFERKNNLQYQNVGKFESHNIFVNNNAVSFGNNNFQENKENNMNFMNTQGQFNSQINYNSFYSKHDNFMQSYPDNNSSFVNNNQNSFVQYSNDFNQCPNGFNAQYSNDFSQCPNGFKQNLFSLPQPRSLFQSYTLEFTNFQNNSILNANNCPYQQYTQMMENNIKMCEIMNQLVKRQQQTKGAKNRQEDAFFQSYIKEEWKLQRQRQARYYQRWHQPEQVIQVIIKRQSISKQKYEQNKYFKSKRPLESNNKVNKKQKYTKAVQTKQSNSSKIKSPIPSSSSYKKALLIQIYQNQPNKTKHPKPVSTTPFQISWREKPVVGSYQLQFVNNDLGVIQFDSLKYKGKKNKWMAQRKKTFQNIIRKEGVPLCIQGQQKFEKYPQNLEIKQKIKKQVEKDYPQIQNLHIKLEEEENLTQIKSKQGSDSTAVSYSSICKQMNLRPQVISSRTEQYQNGKMKNIKLRYVYPLVLLFQNDPESNENHYKYSYRQYNGNKVFGLKIWNQYGEVTFKEALEIGPNPERRRLNQKKFAIGKFQIYCNQKWLDSPCECKFYGMSQLIRKYMQKGQKYQAMRCLKKYQCKQFNLKQISTEQPYSLTVQINKFDLCDYQEDNKESVLVSAKQLAKSSINKIIRVGESLAEIFVFAISPWKW